MPRSPGQTGPTGFRQARDQSRPSIGYHACASPDLNPMFFTEPERAVDKHFGCCPNPDGPPAACTHTDNGWLEGVCNER